MRACGSCHRSEGTGGPENSSLAGLSVDYFVQQMADFKSGARKFSGPQRSAVLLMTAAAEAATDAEVQAAAEYFSALKPKRIVKVVESDTAPKTYIARLFFVKRAEGGTEPLGRRIVEMPNDVGQFELRDTRSQFTVGSVARGEALAKTGGSDKKPNFGRRTVFTILRGNSAGDDSRRDWPDQSGASKDIPSLARRRSQGVARYFGSCVIACMPSSTARTRAPPSASPNASGPFG